MLPALGIFTGWSRRDARCDSYLKIMSMLLWNGDEAWITIWKSAMELE